MGFPDDGKRVWIPSGKANMFGGKLLQDPLDCHGIGLSNDPVDYEPPAYCNHRGLLMIDDHWMMIQIND